MPFDLNHLKNRLQQLPRDPAFYQQALHQCMRRAWTNRPSPQQLLRYALLTTGLLLSMNLLLLLAVYLGAFGPLPSQSDLLQINNANASEIYAIDGNQLGKYYDQNRTNASLAEVPYFLVNGLIATEDARFYQHRGVDYRALLRVFLRTILLGNRSSGGGSTLSQQLVKNVYGRNNHGLLTIPVNKIREIILAHRLEKAYSKSAIMELYLNTVPFGERDVYGIKVAARRFFNKSLFELNIQEAAVLIGLLKGNTLYNPILHPEAALQRRNTVLQRMAQADFLTPIQCDSLQQLPLKTNYLREGSNQGPATYFRAHLREELETALRKIRKPDGSPYDLKQDGLKIYTTIDARLQSYAESAINEVMPLVQDRFNQDWKGKDPVPSDLLAKAIQNSARYQSLLKQGLDQTAAIEAMQQPVPMRLFAWNTPNDYPNISPIDSIRQLLTTLHAGMVVADPHTGAIRAWVGGIDYGYFQYDHVKSSRQVGSTFKPIVYAQALEDTRYPCDYFENERLSYPEFEDWSPRNSNDQYGGYYSMPGALSHSVNTVTVQLAMETGLDRVREQANRLGIKGTLPEGPAISLGTADASLLEMITVYGTFANEGRRPAWHYLDRIEDRNGQVIFEYPKPDPATFEQVLSPATNALMVNLLETVVDSGTAQRLRFQYGIQGPLAAKTGTTQYQADGWLLGFTPQLVFGAWVGAELPAVHFRTLYRGQGANTALPLIGSFLQKTYQDPHFQQYPNADFPPLVDSLAYLLQCPHFLDELPNEIIQLNDYFQQPDFMNRLYQELQAYQPIELKPPRRNESATDYIERMRRLNDRQQRQDQRREDLKNFWKDKLFGDKRNN